jgi:hypothetical protein
VQRRELTAERVVGYVLLAGQRAAQQIARFSHVFLDVEAFFLTPAVSLMAHRRLKLVREDPARIAFR